jgi:hypothetical protein
MNRTESPSDYCNTPNYYELGAILLIGFFFTLLYHFYSNLLVIGFSHAILGNLAFSFVLGTDPFAVLLGGSM